MKTRGPGQRPNAPTLTWPSGVSGHRDIRREIVGRSVRTGRYRYNVWSPDGDFELYDHASNEEATRNLDLRLPAGSVSLAGDWDIEFTSENMDVIAVYLSNDADSSGRHPLFVSEEQRRRGTFTVPGGLLKKAGTLQVWRIGEHPLGRLKLRQDIRLVK